MKATDMRHLAHPAGPTAIPTPQRQRGIFTVEFSLVAGIFFVVMFGVIEVARALYMWNTLQEVTRRAGRAAAATNFSSTDDLAQLRKDAVFSSAAGVLPVAAPITWEHVVVDYLSLEDNGDGSMTKKAIPTAALPGCPARNRLNCTSDSNGSNCIRYVRVRICQPGTACTPVPYVPLLPLINMPMNLPISTTIERSQSLGYSPGAEMCN